jgi:hypothetical protein
MSEFNYFLNINNNKSTKPEHVREWNKNEFSNYIYHHGFKIISHTLESKSNKDNRKLNQCIIFKK